MINNVTLVGRLTKDPDLRKTPNNTSTISFSLACDDPYKKDHTDFVNCVAWQQSAEFLAKYAKKGDVIGCTGKIATRSYDGQYGKVYVTEVICNRVVIAGRKKQDEYQTQTTQDDVYENYEQSPDLEIDPDDLPFF